MTLRSFSTSSTPRRIHDPSLATFVRVAALPGFHLPRPPDPASLAPATPAPSGSRPLPTLAAPFGGLAASSPVATAGYSGARFKSHSERRTSSS